MKYWAYLVAKLVGVAGLSIGLRKLVYLAVSMKYEIGNGDDIRAQFVWSCAMFAWALVTAGMVWLAILDQKYRCRTCLHKLRMPVATGQWDKAILFSRPKMEWICPYGHGTMNEPQVQLLGRENVEWDEHEDIWKELESIGAGQRD